MPLEELIRDYNAGGLGATFSAGQKYAADRDSTLANTAYRQAETNRYAQMTPYEVQKAKALAEQTELANLQEQANQRAGVHDVVAQEALFNHKMKAQVAQNTWNDLGKDKQLELTNNARSLANGMANIAIEAFHNTGSMKAAFDAQAQHVQANAHKLPEGEAERWLGEIQKGYLAAQTKYGKNTDQWLADAMAQQKAIAISAVNSDPKALQASQIQSQKDKAEMDRAQLQADAGISQARIHAAAAGSRQDNNLSAVELTNRLHNIYNDTTQPVSVRNQAAQQYNDMNTRREIIYNKLTNSTEERTIVTGGLLPILNDANSSQRAPTAFDKREAVAKARQAAGGKPSSADKPEKDTSNEKFQSLSPNIPYWTDYLKERKAREDKEKAEAEAIKQRLRNAKKEAEVAAMRRRAGLSGVAVTQGYHNFDRNK